MPSVFVSSVMESPEGWGIRLAKNWHSMEEWSAWTKLKKVLMRYRDVDWQTWTRTGSQELSHFVTLANNRKEASLTRQAFIGDLESVGLDVKEEKQRTSGHPYREGLELLAKIIEGVLKEDRNEYVVRGGSEILVRREDEPRNAWRWETFPKVLYFSPTELVKKPRGPTDLQNYVFKRDGMLYAIDARRFYLMPS